MEEPEEVKEIRLMDIAVRNETGVDFSQLTKSDNYEYVEKLHQILDVYNQSGRFTKDNFEINYNNEGNGLFVLQELFYLYLLKKYTPNCLLFKKNVIGKDRLLKEYMGRYMFDFAVLPTDPNQNKYELSRNAIKAELIDDLWECVHTNPHLDVFVIYVSLIFNIKNERMGHANVIIYNRNLGLMQHFEPHGSYIQSGKNIIVNRSQIYDLFENMTKEINRRFQKEPVEIRQKSIRYVPPSEVCPRRKGLQILESIFTAGFQKKYRKKMRDMGYCHIWSCFFAELSILNSNMSSRELHERILQFVDTKIYRDQKEDSPHSFDSLENFVKENETKRNAKMKKKNDYDRLYREHKTGYYLRKIMIGYYQNWYDILKQLYETMYVGRRFEEMLEKTGIQSRVALQGNMKNLHFLDNFFDFGRIGQSKFVPQKAAVRRDVFPVRIASPVAPVAPPSKKRTRSPNPAPNNKTKKIKNCEKDGKVLNPATNRCVKPEYLERLMRKRK